MIEYGFFASCENDRTYTDEDFAKYYSSLVSSGVVLSSSADLQVVADTNMTLNICDGTAMIEGRWLRVKNNFPVTLSNSDGSYPRYDRIVARCNYADRKCEIVVIKGTPASNPTIPSVVRNGTFFDLSLAVILVNAGSTSISQSCISDTRSDLSCCGWVTGLINQIDTTTLFAQYEAEWQLLKGACEDDAPAVIAAWNALNAVKKANNISPVDGNISLTQDNIPDSDTYFRQSFKTQKGIATTTSQGILTVTFPTPFTTVPGVLATVLSSTTNKTYLVYVNSITTTDFSVSTREHSGSTSSFNTPFSWLAMGV